MKQIVIPIHNSILLLKKGRHCLVAKTSVWLTTDSYHHPWLLCPCLQFDGTVLRCLKRRQGRRTGKYINPSTLFHFSCRMWIYFPRKTLFLGEESHPPMSVVNQLLVHSLQSFLDGISNISMSTLADNPCFKSRVHFRDSRPLSKDILKPHSCINVSPSLTDLH